MVLPRISFLDALSLGEVSWLTPPSEASDSDSDLSEAPVYPSSPGTISTMRRIPAEEVPSREVVQVRGLQQGRVVKRKGSGEMEGTGERSSSGRGKRSGEVREGKGVEEGLRRAGEDMGEVERTPFEIVEKRYACAVGMEKWERGTMIVWAGGERESLARTRLRLLKSLAGLPPDAPRPQDSMKEDTSYYDEGVHRESTFGGSQGEELPETVKF